MLFKSESDAAKERRLSIRQETQRVSVYFSGQRRQMIPQRVIQPSNLWAIMKSSIGKDLSKISVPVSFVWSRQALLVDLLRFLSRNSKLMGLCLSMGLAVTFIDP